MVAFVAFGVWYQLEKAREEGEWVLAFEDDFEREELGPDWKSVHGVWRVHDGALCCSKGHSEIKILKFFTGDVRVEYEARAAEWPVCSMSCVLNGKDPEPLATGYYLGFGDNLNVRSYILRQGAMVANNQDALVGRDVLHKIVAERIGSRVSLYVDGEAVNSFEDLFPLKGEAQGRVCFYSTFSHVHFDNVKVYKRAGAEKLSRTSAADMLFEEGAYGRAAREYEQASRTFSGRKAEMARFKEFLSIQRAGLVDDGQKGMENLLEDAKDELVRANCAATLAEMEFLSRSVEKGWKILIDAGMEETTKEAKSIMVFSTSRVTKELSGKGEHRKAFELGFRLMNEFGGGILPPWDMFSLTIGALSRQKRFREMRELAAKVTERTKGKLSKANDVFLYFADALGSEFPAEAADMYLEAKQVLKAHGWTYAISFSSPSAQEFLALAGKQEYISRFCPEYEHLLCLAQGDVEGARRSALSVIEALDPGSVDFVVLLERGFSALKTLICVEDLRGVRKSAEILMKIGRSPMETQRIMDNIDLLLVLADLAAGEKESAKKVFETSWKEIFKKKGPEKWKQQHMLYGFLAGEVPESELREAWVWGARILGIGKAQWDLDFWLGVKAELDGDHEVAVRRYRAAFEQMKWKVAEWYFVKNALRRLEKRDH
jgi:hypothetical protein